MDIDGGMVIGILTLIGVAFGAFICAIIDQLFNSFVLEWYMGAVGIAAVSLVFIAIFTL